jgi:hypothetical protein
MAPLITHIVVGERVFLESNRFAPGDLGPFLLGCILVDVHFFRPIDRRTTHFAGRFAGENPDAYDKSCDTFLHRLDHLLRPPLGELTSAEQAFIAGYLCHLGADEEWKRFDWHMITTQGIRWWADLPVPGDVLLTAFDVLSTELYREPAAIGAALADVCVPDVMTHVPHSVFVDFWDIARDHALNGRTTESYLQMLRRMGRSPSQVRVARCEHEACWTDALTLTDSLFGGVPSRVEAMVQWSLREMPRLLTDVDRSHARVSAHW